eukprot:143651-Chlamydomonas_euryale.AAC.1
MTSIAVISAPRLAGDKKPHSAKTIVATTIEKICTPVPTCVASSDAPGGGRNTSPCTCARRRLGKEGGEGKRRLAATTVEKICTPQRCRAERLFLQQLSSSTPPPPSSSLASAHRSSFHPDSSALISASSWLYLLMSRASARSRMTATIALRNSTMSIELTIENQWMSSSYMWRYRSQRLTQRTSLDCTAAKCG